MLEFLCNNAGRNIFTYLYFDKNFEADSGCYFFDAISAPENGSSCLLKFFNDIVLQIWGDNKETVDFQVVLHKHKIIARKNFMFVCGWNHILQDPSRLNSFYFAFRWYAFEQIALACPAIFYQKVA